MYIATPHALEGGVSRGYEIPLIGSRQHVDVDYGPYGSRLKGPRLEALRARVQKGSSVQSIATA